MTVSTRSSTCLIDPLCIKPTNIRNIIYMGDYITYCNTRHILSFFLKIVYKNTYIFLLRIIDHSLRRRKIMTFPGISFQTLWKANNYRAATYSLSDLPLISNMRSCRLALFSPDSLLNLIVFLFPLEVHCLLRAKKLMVNKTKLYL